MDNESVDKIGIPVFKKERGKAMKVVKSQGLLFIFEMLKEKGYISKNEVLNALEISELSFWRYIQEIKAFLYNFNMDYDLIFDRIDEVYRLVKKLYICIIN